MENVDQRERSHSHTNKPGQVSANATTWRQRTITRHALTNRNAVELCASVSAQASIYGPLSVHSWIAHELQVGISLGRRHNLVGFQI